MSRDKVKKVDYSKLGQEPIGRRRKRSQENRKDQKKRRYSWKKVEFIEASLKEEYNGLEERRNGGKKVEFIKGRDQFARRIEWIREKERDRWNKRNIFRGRGEFDQE
jgi:hypothetical protein